MPLSNPFRRAADRPSLRERAAALRASFRPVAPVAAPAPTASPAPGSAEAMAAFHEACRQHSIRTAPLHECPELMRAGQDVWSTQSLMQALEAGEIGADEYARLHPLASERELQFAEVTHELNIGALFALAYAAEYPVRQEDAAEPNDKPSDLLSATLDGWAAWGATLNKSPTAAEAEAAFERASAHRDNLLYAAMSLPATVENIPAKALACAWMEWVEAERLGQPRDAYGPADQLVYDIHAAAMARGVRQSGGLAPVSAELPLSALAPTVNFAGASMEELRAIREAADMVCAVASAATWQGCNRRRNHPSGVAIHNQAGDLMRWVSDALGFVVTAAEAEARRRSPESSDEQKTRLFLLAGSVIDNDDHAETAAFARDLVATVQP